MSDIHLSQIQTEAKALYDNKAYEACLTYIAQYFTLPHWSNQDLSTLYLMMGNTYASVNKYNEAIIYLKKSIHLNSRNGPAYFALGNAYQCIKKLKFAQFAYEKAIQFNPYEPYYYLNLGSIYRTLDRIDDAIASYRQLIALKPDFAMGYRNLVQCIKYDSVNNDDYRAIKKLIEGSQIGSTQEMHCHFALAKILHDSGFYDEAFPHFSKANQIRSKNNPYHKEEIKTLVDNYTQLFTPDFFLNTPKGSYSQRPIFIIGLPRSGKTLLQKILCCDRRIAGFDELNLIDSMLRQLNLSSSHRNDKLTLNERLNKDTLIAMGLHYLDETRNGVSDLVMKTVDTTPYHFKYLGMINLIFPNAKIIHVKRNYYDHCLQIFMKYFVSGNFYTYNLRDLAHFYEHYNRLMMHWDRVLPADILSINYEDIVKDPIQTTGNIFNFLELEVHSEFYSNLNNLIIHQDEVGQWIHYKSHFKKIFNQLNRGAPYDSHST